MTAPVNGCSIYRDLKKVTIEESLGVGKKHAASCGYPDVSKLMFHKTVQLFCGRYYVVIVTCVSTRPIFDLYTV